MFALDKNGNAVCTVAYRDIQKGAVVPRVNELWAQVEESVALNGWDSILPIEKVNAGAVKANEIRESYLAAIIEDVAYMGTIFQADEYSQDLITKCIAAGSVPSGFYWKDLANNKVAMSFPELQGLAMALLTRNQTHFVHLQGKKVDLENMVVDPVSVVSDIEGIVW